MAVKLATKGGPRTVPEGMVKPYPQITDADRQAVMEVLQCENLGEQRRIQAESLAKEWAEWLGVKFCIPCNSGTSALHMAVAGLGIGPGDEVIIPAFTYWASAAAVLHHNAIPVFVDIRPDIFTIDPKLIEEKITEHTRAIMPVHIHGMPADMDEIKAIAAKHKLAVIEDCAQSHGARYKGRVTGTMGNAAGFSTQASKNLTTGSEGGLFVTDDEQVYKLAQLLQYLGEIVVPGRERATQEYNAYGLGWMYRGDVFGQAFVRSQLRRLNENNRRKRENCLYLSEHLRKIPGVKPPVLLHDRETVFYNYVVRFVPEEVGIDVPARTFREKVQEALRAEGVDMGQWQRMPVPAQEIFQKQIGYGRGCPWKCHGRKIAYNKEEYPETWRFLDSHSYLFGITAPNGLELMKLYVDAFEKVLSQAKELF